MKSCFLKATPPKLGYFGTPYCLNFSQRFNLNFEQGLK